MENARTFYAEIDAVTVETTRGPIHVRATVETNDVGGVLETFEIIGYGMCLAGLDFTSRFPVDRVLRPFSSRGHVLVADSIQVNRKDTFSAGYLLYSASMQIDQPDKADAILIRANGSAAPRNRKLERALEEEVRVLLRENPALFEHLRAALEDVAGRALQAYYEHEAELDQELEDAPDASFVL